ncbi:D-serine dehydratase [compost metagenome]
MQRLIDGYYTVSDEELYRLLAIAWQEERIRLEPSALAGVPGMLRVLREPDYLARIGVTPERLANATHLVWGTGGSMVPEAEFAAYLEKGRALLRPSA